MSCPQISNLQNKDVEKVLKYGPIRWEIKQQLPSYRVEQYNVINDVLRGSSKDLDYHNKKDARSSWKRHTIKDAEGSDFQYAKHRANI